MTVVSGGQTGVDRAALDAALACGTPCGGWMPADRRAEDGEVPARYPLQALPKGGYHARMVANLRLADGTAVIHHGTLEGGTAETVRQAVRLGRPLLVVDAAEASPARAAELLRGFCEEKALQSLNIAGPRAGKWPGGHAYVLEAVTLLLRGARQAGVPD